MWTIHLYFADLNSPIYLFSRVTISICFFEFCQFCSKIFINHLKKGLLKDKTFSHSFCLEIFLYFKSLLESYRKMIFYISLFPKYRSSSLDVFRKKGVLKNFAKFTGQHLFQSPFFNTIVIM